MNIKKEYLIAAAALLIVAYLYFVAPTKNKNKEEAVSADRERQIVGNVQPTITEVEARNICRKINESLGYTNVWWQITGSEVPLYQPLKNLWSLIENNKANAVLIIKAWRGLNYKDYPNLTDALNSEYLAWGSETSEIRTNVVNFLTELAV